jgi:hypothetical protein
MRPLLEAQLYGDSSPVVTALPLSTQYEALVPACGVEEDTVLVWFARMIVAGPFSIYAAGLTDAALKASMRVTSKSIE